jgi:hypothetical protein
MLNVGYCFKENTLHYYYEYKALSVIGVMGNHRCVAYKGLTNFRLTNEFKENFFSKHVWSIFHTTQLWFYV